MCHISKYFHFISFCHKLIPNRNKISSQNGSKRPTSFFPEIWYRSHSIFEEVNNLLSSARKNLMKCEGYFLFEKIIWEMKAIRIKPMHSKFKSLRQFPFLKKIKNFHFEGYFHARKGQFYQARPHSVRGTLHV